MEVRIDGNALQMGALRVTFHRTLRIPDNGRQYPLPPSLGAFPLLHVEGQPEAKAELRVVLEQGVGPGRPSTEAIGRIGGGR